MAKRKRWNRLVLFTFGSIGAAALFSFMTNRAVLGSADGRIYTEVEKLPEKPVGLVLGTAPTVRGYRNLFFERRMAAAVELYKDQKVRKLLVSGDNGTRSYDEPTAMRDALVARGIPERDIVLDYAGFRTLDSVVRAKNVFGLDRCVIVTDDFHLPRALYIAQEHGLDAVGYQTEPLPRNASPWTFTREVGARTLVWMDIHLLNTQPKFAGPPEPIQL